MDDNNSPININQAQSGELTLIAREQAEVQARILSAKRFPRNELDAATKLKTSMRRPALAEKSVWNFKRGKDPETGKDRFIEGPSVHTAREAARCWGNMVTGVRVVSMDDQYVHIRGFCMDLETNMTKETDEKFKKLIWRKGFGNQEGRWITPDERQLRELINKHGAITERNAILQVIPKDIIDDAILVAKKTMRDKAKGDLKENKGEILKRLADKFSDFGVSAKAIEEFLGHELSMLTEDELVQLRTIYASLEAGNSKPYEYFGGKSEDATEAEKSLTENFLRGAQ